MKNLIMTLFCAAGIFLLGAPPANAAGKNAAGTDATGTDSIFIGNEGVYIKRGWLTRDVNSEPDKLPRRWIFIPEASVSKKSANPNILHITNISQLGGVDSGAILTTKRDEDWTFVFPFTLSMKEAENLKNLGKTPSLYISYIGDNWEIYINGQIVRSEIYTNNYGQITRHRAMSNVYAPIDSSLLKEGKNYAAIHLIGAPNYQKTAIGTIELTSYYEQERRLSQIFTSIGIGLCLIIGVYHCLLFFISSKEKSNLFFAFFILMLNSFYCSQLDVFISISDSITLDKVQRALFLLGSGAFFCYAEALFLPVLSRRVFVYSSCAALVSLSFFIIPPTFMEAAISYGQFLPVLFFILEIIFIVRAFRADNRYKTTCGYFFVMPHGAKILTMFAFAMLPFIYFFDVNAFSLFNVLYWTASILSLHSLIKETKRAHGELEQYNIHLEEAVHERTRELQEKTDALEENKILLEERTSAAIAASQAKSNFLAKMSHEIRTPMNAILGITTLMKTENLDDVQKDYFANIRGMANALLQIINDILDFSKIESGKLELVPVHYNLRGFYESLTALHTFIAHGKELSYVSNFSNELPEVLFGDEIRMRQIVINVVNNAIKYTKRGGVTVNFEYKKDWRESELLCISVIDTGQGIKEENLATLFGEFEQFDRNENRGLTGSGLGLAITKQLAELMNGRIEVETEYGKGSTFRIVVPLVRGDPSKIEYKNKDDNNFVRVKQGEKILALIVDDTPVNLMVAKGFLTNHGLTIETAESGLQALEKTLEKDYDIIFMDHMMPGMDGVEAVKKIRKRGEKHCGSSVIIALSANAVSGAREMFLQAGMNDFVSKPIEPKKLNQVLLSFLPPDKIETISENFIQSTESSLASGGSIADENPIIAALSKIEGLDTRTGRGQTGGTVPYIEVLKTFCKSCDEIFDIVRSDVKNSDWKDYGIRLHGFKGSLNTIGCADLARHCRRLEFAGKIASGQIEATDEFNWNVEEAAGVCEESADTILEELTTFKQKLIDAGIFESGRAVSATVSAAEKITITREEFIKKLNDLKTAADNYDISTLDSISSEFAALAVDEAAAVSLEKISEAILKMDYDIVSAEADKLLATR